jgi:outer membrane protein OmpA-like peptidoglycan-associated protein
VTLVGTTTLNGSDTGLALARARAATVRDYLRRAWAIDDARIGVDARALPARPSDTTSADGRAENRRVEIVVDDPDVLAPVVTADTLRSVTPPIIRFRPAVTGAIDAASWRIAATQRDATLTSFEGAGPLPDSLDWDTNADQLAVPDASDSLRYALRVVDRAGKEVVARGALPVEVVTLQRKREERVGDRVIDRYSLILFDYDRSDLDAANARIAQEIGRHITPQATVTVSGHTDRMGDEAHNQRLSEDRARSLATALGIAPERASGDGEHPLLYDNDLPEGRFYSRTVTVIVETPR